MGGGRQCLQSSVNGSTADPIDTWGCYSTDGRDLIKDWEADKINIGASFQVLNNNQELKNLDLNKEYTLGKYMTIITLFMKNPELMRIIINYFPIYY